MKLIYSVLFFAFFLSIGSNVLAEEKPNPKVDMHLLLQDILSLENYLLSEKEFLNPENQKEIAKLLNETNDHAQGMEKNKAIFKDDFSLRTNISMLAQHMLETKKYYNENNKPFARLMLKSALQMCISCHARNEKGADLSLLLVKNTKENSLDRADFALATRQFSNAKNSYRNLIENYPENHLSLSDMQSALLSLAVIETRVQASPKEAADFFQKTSQREDLPSYIRRDLQSWATEFSQWTSEKPLGKKKFTEFELLREAKKLLRKDDFSLVDTDRKFHVKRLRASALLHTLLEMPGKGPEKGEALYLLGLIYSRVQHSLFFHFDETYFKTCIHEYKKTKIAHDCYDALERIESEGYTGSGGTNIPADVQNELIDLKHLAY